MLLFRLWCPWVLSILLKKFQRNWNTKVLRTELSEFSELRVEYFGIPPKQLTY